MRGIVIAGLCIAGSFGRSILTQQCYGCEGSDTDSDSTTGGGASCPTGTVSITVEVKDGACEFAPLYPAGGECLGSPCKAKISRAWSGLPPNTALEWCYSAGGESTCVDPPPSTGPSGQSSSPVVRIAWMSCNGVTYSFFNTHSCGLSASATGSCSDCSGS